MYHTVGRTQYFLNWIFARSSVILGGLFDMFHFLTLTYICETCKTLKLNSPVSFKFFKFLFVKWWSLCFQCTFKLVQGGFKQFSWKMMKYSFHPYIWENLHHRENYYFCMVNLFPVLNIRFGLKLFGERKNICIFNLIT